MQQRQLGSTGPRTFPLGLGCMGMSDLYGPSDRQEALATLRMALDAGMTLLDTGDFYGMGPNELLFCEALAAAPRVQVQIRGQFGALLGPGGAAIGQYPAPAAG